MAGRLTVLAPLGGTVVAMADVPDQVFADALVGPGMTIDPPRTGEVTVGSPVAGTIVTLHPHAFVVQVDSAHAVLVHLGLDTVELAGEGFTVHATKGATVAVGDPVVTWDPGRVEAGGRSPMCPVIAVQGDRAAVRGLAEVGREIRAGEPFLEWD